MTTTKADPAPLAIALNTYARTADHEASKARAARDRLIRQMHDDGYNMTELADRLGVRRSYLYRIIKTDAG